jgi:hypothetical protein
VMIGVSCKTTRAPLLARPLLVRVDFDEEGVLVVDVGERAERMRSRRHRDLTYPGRRLHEWVVRMAVRPRGKVDLLR